MWSQSFTFSTYITNCSRVIRHAWYFYYALGLVVKGFAEAYVLRASHLNKALTNSFDPVYKLKRNVYMTSKEHFKPMPCHAMQTT